MEMATAIDRRFFQKNVTSEEAIQYSYWVSISALHVDRKAADNQASKYYIYRVEQRNGKI
jgi:hypothetical protein